MGRIPVLELGSIVPYTIHVGASGKHAPLAIIQIMNQYLWSSYGKIYPTNLQSSLEFNWSFRNEIAPLNSENYLCSPLESQNHDIAVDEVTALPEALEALSTKVLPYNKTTNTPSILVLFLQCISKKMEVPQAPLPIFLWIWSLRHQKSKFGENSAGE